MNVWTYQARVLAGAKRLQALSTLVVAVMILPWALWQFSTQVVNVHFFGSYYMALTLGSFSVVRASS